MKCTSCGTEYTDGENYCPSCGALASTGAGSAGAGRGKQGILSNVRLWMTVAIISLVLAGAAVWVAITGPQQDNGSTKNVAEVASGQQQSQPKPAGQSIEKNQTRKLPPADGGESNIVHFYLVDHPKLPVFGTFEYTETPPQVPREVITWVRENKGVMVRAGVRGVILEERGDFVLVQISDGQNAGKEGWFNKKAVHEQPASAAGRELPSQ